MSSNPLRIICTLAAAFGAWILLVLLVATSQGVLANLDSGTVALKVSGTLIRAACLFFCAWAAWYRPHFAPWFAWGACLAFVIGGAGDQVIRYGIFEGLGNLIPTYYVVSFVHVLVAVGVWLLVRNGDIEAQSG